MSQPRDTKPGFASYRNKGFHITFENGCTVSVQFGVGNYCENRDRWNVENEADSIMWDSRDAEIAAWDANGDWIRPDYEDWGDDVSGWRHPHEVLKFINYIAGR